MPAKPRNEAVSVVIPTILRDTLPRAIASARSQHSVDVEIIVIVDLPEAEVAQRSDLFREADQVLFTGGGARGAEARNIGVQHATHHWVAFLDDDDEWLPHKLRAQLDHAAQFDDDRPIVIASRVIQKLGDLEASSAEVPTRLMSADQPVEDYLFRDRWPTLGRAGIWTSTLLVRTALARRVPWNPNLPRHQDWDWLIRLAHDGNARITQVPEATTVIWMGSADSISSSGDWRTSLAWAEEVGATWHPRTLTDFLTAQPLRYAVQARDLPGVAACTRAILRTRRLPGRSIAFPVGAILPRTAALTAVLRLSSSPRAGKTRPSQARPPVSVLQATNAPDGTTRYVDQVTSQPDPRIEFQYLNTSGVLQRIRFDVIHLHWPEVLVRGSSPAKSTLRCLGLAALLLLSKARGKRIVRTLHNIAPHEPGNRLEKYTLKLVDRLTDHFVTINPVTEAPRGEHSYIPHGHYRDRFAEHPKFQPQSGRILYAGLIRPYKGVPELITAFRALNDPLLSLRIVGRPTEALGEYVQAAASADPRISHRLEFVPDSILVEEMTRAELVCLPYQELHNSGVLLVALSLDRPVLVPATETTRTLQAEVGEEWIQLFTGDLTPEDLSRARLAASLIDRDKRPTLDSRDWANVGTLYNEVFLR